MIDTLSSPDLVSALETNMVAFWASYGRGEGCRLVSTPDLTWFYSGVPHPLMNAVVRFRPPAAAVETTHADLGQTIAARGAPALWWIGPHSDPEATAAALAARGLQPAGEIPGMAVDLAALDAGPSTIPDFTVETVDGDDRRALWARTAALGTGLSPDAADAMARVEATIADPAYRAQRRYLGFLAGEPVASSALVPEAGVAGVYAVATLPNARNRGIGRLMTAVALADARRMGYRIAILQASSMGHPIYLKMGFRDVCTYRLFLQS